MSKYDFDELVERRGTGCVKWDESPEDFQGTEPTLYDVIMMDTCHHIFIQTRRVYNTKNEL